MNTFSWSLANSNSGINYDVGGMAFLKPSAYFHCLASYVITELELCSIWNSFIIEMYLIMGFKQVSAIR